MDSVNADVMRLILNSYLDDADLSSMCMLNRRFNERICTSNFWKNKIVERFGLTGDEIERYRDGNTYWAYYNFLSTLSTTRTPDNLLLYATVKRRLDLLNIAISAGAYLEKYDGRVLRFAVQQNYVEIVDRLLQAGSDPNVDVSDPMDTAINNGNSEIVKLLVDAGADVYQRQIEKARELGYDEIVGILT